MDRGSSAALPSVCLLLLATQTHPARKLIPDCAAQMRMFEILNARKVPNIPTQRDTTTITRPWHCDDMLAVGANNHAIIQQSSTRFSIPDSSSFSHRRGASFYCLRAEHLRLTFFRHFQSNFSHGNFLLARQILRLW